MDSFAPQFPMEQSKEKHHLLEKLYETSYSLKIYEKNLIPLWRKKSSLPLNEEPTKLLVSFSLEVFQNIYFEKTFACI